MRPKIIFWIDASQIHFCIAKYIQDNLDCEMYSIFEITEKPKQFYQNQSLVNFKKLFFLSTKIFFGLIGFSDNLNPIIIISSPCFIK